jgi:hypothetical protein
MTIKWVFEKYLRISNYSGLPSSGLVEFYKSEKTALEEFSLFRKIFTPGLEGLSDATHYRECMVVFI